jgi:methylglutamate dehydrogenase subunit D
VAESPHPFVSALDGVVAAGGRYGRATANPGVVVGEICGAGLATVTASRNRTAAVIDRVRSAFGADLPVRPKRVVGRDIAFVWLGPDQWLAIKQPAPKEGMEAMLAAPLAGLAALVDQSHGRTLLRLTGPHVGDALAKGVPVDLHPRAFMPGDAAATLLSHIPVHLWQTDATPTYEFAVARSLAQSFWRWLATASAPYGLMFVDG